MSDIVGVMLLHLHLPTAAMMTGVGVSKHWLQSTRVQGVTSQKVVTMLFTRVGTANVITDPFNRVGEQLPRRIEHFQLMQVYNIW